METLGSFNRLRALYADTSALETSLAAELLHHSATLLLPRSTALPVPSFLAHLTQLRIHKASSAPDRHESTIRGTAFALNPAVLPAVPGTTPTASPGPLPDRRRSRLSARQDYGTGARF